MKHARWIFWLVVLLLVAAVITLFIVQNLDRTTGLSINLFFFSTQFSQPMSVPLLLIGTFSGGTLVGLVVGFLLRGRGRRSADTLGAAGADLDDAWA